MLLFKLVNKNTGAQELKAANSVDEICLDGWTDIIFLRRL
jgi:hypothetical protein